MDKKREIESLVGSITPESFSQLVSLSKKITDYGEEEENGKNDEDDSGHCTHSLNYPLVLILSCYAFGSLAPSCRNELG